LQKQEEEFYYFLDQDYMLVPPHTNISDKLIELLKKYRYRKVYKRALPHESQEEEKESATKPLSSSTLKHISHELQKMNEARKLFIQLTERFIDLIEEMRKGLFAARLLPNEFAHNIIEKVKQTGNYLLRLEHFSVTDKTKYTAEQAVKTALLCAAIAYKQKYSYYRWIELTIAGLLHNVGFTRIQPELYQKDILSPEKRKLVTIYPYLGTQIAKEMKLSPIICTAILQCRENIDGSGYPQKLKSSQISEFAKIVSICSAYAALVSHRPYKEQNIDGHMALATIIKENGKKYDRQATQLLLSTISLFPIGTFVELENKQQGIVIEAHETNLRAPLVRIIAQDFHPLHEIQIVATQVTPHRIVRTLTYEEKKRFMYLLFPE